MSKKRKPDAKAPWYRRPRALIIGAGALAAAILGVINLWEKVFPPPDEDLARIESINIIKRTPLTGFAPEGIGKDLPLDPVLDAAAIGWLPPRAQFTALPRPTLDPVPTFTVVPWPTDTTTTAASVSPTPTHTTATPGPTPSESTSSGSPAPSPSPTIELPADLSRFTDEYVDDVVGQPPMQAYAPRAREYTARSLVIEAVDDAGAPLPPAQVAEQLAQALKEVETTTGPDGEDPHGWTVAVRVDLEGLKDIPLLLTWSLDGLDVPHSWQADNLAYRVVAATPHDAGVAEIWVPDLRRPGAYNVNIKLSYERSGVIADFQPLALADTGVVPGA